MATIRLPDGRIVENVPDDITQDELIAELGIQNFQQTTGEETQQRLNLITQGLTLGFSDEISDAAAALVPQPGQDFGDNFAELRDQRSREENIFQSNNPIESIGLPALGGLLTGAGSARAINPQNVKQAAALGGAEGAIAGVGFGDSLEERATGAVVGLPTGSLLGAGSQVLGGLADRVFRRVRGLGARTVDNPTLQRRLDEASELGLETTPAQRSDDFTVKQREAGFRSNPATSEIFNGIDFRNQVKGNQIVSRALGQETDSIDDVYLAGRLDDISDQFERAIKGGTVELDTINFAGAINQAESEFTRGIGRPSRDKIFADARQLMRKDKITAKEYQTIRSNALKDIDTALNGKADRARADALSSLVDALDDAAEQSLPNAQLSDFREARKFWRIWKSTEKAIDPTTGNVSFAKLANELRRNEKTRFLRSDEEIFKLGRTSQAFKIGIGNSGTATRLSSDKPIRDALAAIQARNFANNAGQPVNQVPGQVSQSSILPTEAIIQQELQERISE